MTSQPETGWSSLQSMLALVPNELVVRCVEPELHRVGILAEPGSRVAACPRCHRSSHRVHSRYRRRLADLPWQGRTVIIIVIARRFRCDADECPRKVFAEHMPNVAASHARRTSRLADIQCHIGVALGGAAGARLARRLGLPVSGSTLLRLVRRGASACTTMPLRVVGIDDWACGGAGIATGPSSATWNADASSICCPIAPVAPSRTG